MTYTTTTGTSGNDTLTGSAVDDLLQGLGGDDILNGLDGSDRLEGGDGADLMTGGAGNDIYVVDQTGDIVVETGSAPTTIYRASVTDTGAQTTRATYQPWLSSNGSVLTFGGDRQPTGSTGVDAANSFYRILTQANAPFIAFNTSGDLVAGATDAVVSGNGQILAFTSSSNYIVTPDMNVLGDVFLRDVSTGTYTIGTYGDSGYQPMGHASNGRLSYDGQWLAFISNGITFVANDTNNEFDIFVRNTSTGVVERVSVGAGGAQANAGSYFYAMSSDANRFAFESTATNLVAGDTNGVSDIFVRDRTAGTTTRINLASDGSQMTSSALLAGMSGNGRYVLFNATADNLVANDTNGWNDLFRKDLQTGDVVIVNRAANGDQANNHTFSGAGISDDGRFVVFMSTASNLVPHDTNGWGDVFVKDMQTGLIARVSTADDGTQGNNHAWSAGTQDPNNPNVTVYGANGRPTISGDGTTIAFVSAANNLVNGDTNGRSDIFVVGNPFMTPGGNDTVESSITYKLPAYVENLVLTGSANINGTGNDEANLIIGNSGNNGLNGDLGDDTLIGGLGDDTYRVDNLADQVIEAENGGTDKIYIRIPFYTPVEVNGQWQYYTYVLPPQVENLQFIGIIPAQGEGNSLNNEIVGNAGNNILYGWDGNDTLYSQGESTPGGDVLLGGNGDDMYVLASGQEQIVEYMYGGYDTVYSSMGFNFANIIGVEHFVLSGIDNLNQDGTNNGETISGNVGNNIINGLDGWDTLNGGFGDDTLNGGAGQDILSGNAGADTMDAGVGDDWYYVNLGDGVDTINQTGTTTGTDAIKLWGINQSMVSFSRTGNDLILTMRDYLPMSAPQGAVAGPPLVQSVRIVDQYLVGSVDKQIDIIEFDNGTQLQRSAFEFLADPFTGTPGPDTMAGTAGADTLTGLGGNDSYTYNHIDDLAVEVDGGGFDTVNSSVTATLPAFVEVLNLTGSADLAGSGNGLANQINGNSGANWISGEDGNDTIHGNGGHDDIRGGNGGDLLYGDDGDDVLDGGVGADLMNGGAGNDRYTVSEAGDVIEELADGGIDTVVANGDYVLYANLENLELLAGAVNGSGNEGSNWIIGNAASNWIGGGAGGDTIFGRDGNDAVNGDDGDDVLYGEAGDDVLDGGTGINQLIGGTGNDRYIIRNLGDTISEDAGGGTDTAEVHVDNYVPFANVENVILAAGILSASGSSADNWMEGNAGNNFLGGGLGHDALFGFAGNDYLKGDDGDDRLEGGEGDDTLEGNAGVDTMVGGDGNDTYYVDGPGDIIVETTTGGVDTVYSSGFYTLSGNIENLVIIGTQAVDGTGDSGGNWMRGNDQANVLNGAGGNDAIYGGNGNDTLRGGTGDDILAGEAGDDDYIYALGDGADEVTDGAGNDTLTFSAIARSLLSFTRSGDDLLITVDDAGQPGEVAVIGWFVDPANQIEQIVDADGARSAALISALADPAPAAPLALGMASLSQDHPLLAG